MNPRLKALHDKLQALVDRGRTLNAQANLSAEEMEEAAAIPAQIAAARAAIEGVQNLAAATEGANSFLNELAPNATIGGIATTGVGAAVANLLPPVPAGGMQTGDDLYKALSRSRASTKFLMSIPGMTREQARKTAYRMGMWFAASLTGNASARQFCQQNQIPVTRFSGDPMAAGQIESVNEDGGFLVPPEFEAVMIDLREMFGVARRFLRNTPMTRDMITRPRRKSGLTAYFKGEQEGATQSKMGWDDVELIAKKLMVLTRWSNEWNEDAIINAGDTLAGEISYAFAKKEDECAFIGTGAATYGGMVGVTQALFNVYTAAGGVGLIVGAGNTYEELVLSDFTEMVGALPVYADTPQARWFMHKSFYANVCLRLMLAAGGVTAQEISSGAVWKNPHFLGYPVEFVQAMPKVAANSQVPCVLGDLSLAGDFGDRKQTTVAISSDIYFESDELAIRGTERFDVNIHDVGNATDAGPVVGLALASA